MFAGMGSSAGSVMRLHGVPLLEPGSPAPALQRPARPVFRAAEVVREADCMISHMNQMQERERQRRREKRDQNTEAKAQRAAMREALKAALEAREEKKKLDNLRRDGLLEMHWSNRVRALAKHVDSRTADTYWPYEKSRPGLPAITPGEYINELDEHVEKQQRHRMEALVLDRAPPKGKGILEDRLAAEPVELSKREKDLVAARRREHVQRQAELRRQLAAESDPSSLSYADKLTSDLQRATFQRRLREQRLKKELKEILQKQQADKRARELAEHRQIHGGHCDHNVLSTKYDARHLAHASRLQDYKRELEAQIRVQKAERRRRQEELDQIKGQYTERAIIDEGMAIEQEKQRGASQRRALPLEWHAQRVALHNARAADKAAASATGLR